MLRLNLLAALILIFSSASVYASPQSGAATILRHQNETVVLIDKAGRTDSSVRLELNLSGSGIITMYSGAESKKLRFSIGEKKENINIYRGTAGIFPDRISITGSTENFDLFSAEVIDVQNGSTPLPADIGHIIFSDFSAARSEDWELYSWNLIPGVLIFDTADYEVQSRLFKRLAFFVEKPGFVGTLVSNENLEGRHGWNAHDYRAADLARFFSLAEKENFILNPEELALRKILTDGGIIIDDGDKYTPGAGAILSVSRETEPNWRYRFLTHECLHGLYFTDSGFRDDAEKTFNALDSGEAEFWKHLLDYRRYDVKNTDLLVNEFMAYSLQQPIEEVDDYFKGFLYKRMTAARPYEASFVDKFELSHPESFRNSAISLGKVLNDYTGRQPGHLANLYPENLPDTFFNLFPPAQ